MAEKRSARFTVNVGYVALLLACVLHLLLALVWQAPRLPWSMLPLILQGIGVQLAFPTLTLLLLDRFPSQRGNISSVQAFASLLLCSVGGRRAIADVVDQHVAAGVRCHGVERKWRPCVVGGIAVSANARWISRWPPRMPA